MTKNQHVSRLTPAAKFLRHSFSLFRDENDWTKGEYARDENGDETSPMHGRQFYAVCHCITGAMRSASNDLSDLSIAEKMKAHVAVVRAINISIKSRDLPSYYGSLSEEKLQTFIGSGQYSDSIRELEHSIVKFNDNCNTSFDDVMFVYHESMRLAMTD